MAGLHQLQLFGIQFHHGFHGGEVNGDLKDLANATVDGLAVLLGHLDEHAIGGRVDLRRIQVALGLFPFGGAVGQRFLRVVQQAGIGVHAVRSLARQIVLGFKLHQ